MASAKLPAACITTTFTLAVPHQLIHAVRFLSSPFFSFLSFHVHLCDSQVNHAVTMVPALTTGLPAVRLSRFYLTALSAAQARVPLVFAPVEARTHGHTALGAAARPLPAVRVAPKLALQRALIKIRTLSLHPCALQPP